MGREALYRPTVIEVNLSAIDYNIERFRSHLPEEVQIMAIVKANGYGHGAVPIAKRAIAAGATRLGVSVLDEALELREAGVTAPILVLGYTPLEGLRIAQQHGISCTMYSEEQVDAAIRLQALAESDRPLCIHLKVETGMNRLGFTDVDAFLNAARKIVDCSYLHLEGVFTHFARADEEDSSSTLAQKERFHAFAKRLKEQQIEVDVIHVNNSAGAIHYPHCGHTTVRLGISLYGLYPSRYSRESKTIELMPALTLKSAIVHLKKVPAGSPISYGGTHVTSDTARIATIPIGYGDGYSRALSNRAEVLVCGVRAQVVGRVCMDQLMIDVTHIPEVALGDEVVFIGKQGTDEITADEVAAWCGTINYEVVTGLLARIRRTYIG